MARKNRTPEENARREKIRELLQKANIGSMDDIQNLFKETIAEFMENGLEAELDDELGYSKYDYKNKDTDNSRNGHSSKTLRTSFGDVEVSVPRDRKGEFEPQVLKKNQTSISQDIEEKILSMYAKGMTTSDIEAHIQDLVEQAISQLRATSAALAALKQEMQSLAASLPEYPVVMEMFGVGPALGPQLMAEIGDVRRFHSKKALVAFAGIDAPPYQSGQMDVRSRSISKRVSASLRRTLFLVMGVLLQCAPMDEPVYQFMNKKRSEGKPYRVYMMASANKFLRIYYASVKTYLDSLEHN